MTWGEKGQLATVVIASLCILAVIVKRAREWYVKPLTVESEDAECRGAVKAIAQHYPPLQLIDDEPLDDPVWALVDRMHGQNTASM